MTIWIDSKSSLASIVNELLDLAKVGPVYLAMDTEFIREKSYYAQLCLIQLAYENKAFLIDPLSIDNDIELIKPLLTNTNIIKIFHSGRQDLEIFWHHFKVIPSPFFDTQIAAMACGFGESVAYHALIEALLKTSIDKGSRLTDWKMRPLNEHQKKYALADVTELLKAYHILYRTLMKMERMEWIKEETDFLLNPSLYEPNPETAWEKIKTKPLKPRAQEALKRLAAAREIEAIRLDVPRSHVIKDEWLIEIAQALPEATGEVKRLRGLSVSIFQKEFGSKLLEICSAVKGIPQANLSRFTDKKSAEVPVAGAVIDLLKLLLKIMGDQEKVAYKLLASRDDLDALVRAIKNPSLSEDCILLKGWRYNVFGQKAVQLIRGESGIVWDGRAIQLVDLKKP
jgi:ribonuclease D